MTGVIFSVIFKKKKRRIKKMNYRRCTEEEIYDVVEAKVNEIINEMEIDSEDVDREKFDYAVSDIVSELIDTEIFYDYAEDEEGEWIYSFSKPDEKIDDELLSKPMSDEDTKFLNDSIRQMFSRWAIYSALTY